ncbi:MAG: NfeD family protein [Cyanobacteria bacterium P01_A01_bin.15]
MFFEDLPDEYVEGLVDEVVRPGKEWRIKVHGVYWYAMSQAERDFSPGDYVRVVGRKNLRLIIAPC